MKVLSDIFYKLNISKDIKLSKRGKIMIAAGIFAFLILLLISLFAIKTISDKNTKRSEAETVLHLPPSPSEAKSRKVDISKREVDNVELDNMLKKADMLYESGNIDEALKMFEEVAMFSESMANFNLGTIKFREGDYKSALKSYDDSIKDDDDNISNSAINAAISAYRLNDEQLFQYYIDLGNSSLYRASSSPIYSYNYALLKYYNKNYFEALSPLMNPSSNFYQSESDILASNLFLMFNDDENALRHLIRKEEKKNYYNIALLYARVGDYANARRYMYEFMVENPRDQLPPEVLMALNLIEIKDGNMPEVSEVMDRIENMVGAKDVAFAHYPVKLTIKEEMFDLNNAQNSFWSNTFEVGDINSYKILFYYAPYRVFNAKEALSVITDKSVGLKYANIDEAKDVLVKGATISRVNQNIAKGIRELLNNSIRGALVLMEDSAKMYPNYAVLNYNLGLLYAQMGDFDASNEYFMRAYNLNNYDVLSAIFAIITSKITHKDYRRILNSLLLDFESIKFNSKSEKDFYRAMVGHINGNVNSDMRWLENEKNIKPIHHAFSAVYSISKKDKNGIEHAFGKLKEFYERDPVTNILYELGSRYGENLKDVSLDIAHLFRADKLNLSSIYNGPVFAMELYVYIGFITGTLGRMEGYFNDRLSGESGSTNGIMQALALTSIYSGEFEKAFSIYNNLIDVLGESDGRTRFLASVAAIGAGHHENAVALLQLAKMRTLSSYESRYALGLLYLEKMNLKAASSNFGYIKDKKFRSQFFDFEIDSSRILDGHYEGDVANAEKKYRAAKALSEANIESIKEPEGAESKANDSTPQ